MRPTLDPLRYGIRALDEMAREQASVTPPPPSRAEEFSPHPVLRPAARDGAALSLRLFTDADDDATALVLGDETSRRFAPIPPRAASLFEAHAAVMASGGEESLTVGFPLVTFVQQGSARAAPLFSRGGGRARWMTGEATWKLPANAREGVTFPLPDALVLELGDGEPYTLHAGVWHFLFGLDGAALAAIAAAGRTSTSALVRAATRVLESGGEDTEIETPSTDDLTREDLAALAEAAARRASPSRALRCHPHGLAMLPPRGDPTSGLRTDLHDVMDEPLPPRGPLAVYLGASPGPIRKEPIFTSGKMPPTPSQLEAARAFEGSEDIVAVCGPPGCGKTALLHHVTAQTVVACALGTLWSNVPSRAAAWPLVVTSTNNGAVDHALAPFLSGPGLPVGIRLGNRRTLAETTSASLAAMIEALEKPGELSLPDARAAFEALAAPARAFLRDRADARKARATESERRQSLEKHAVVLRDELARVSGGPPPAVELVDLEATDRALREHAEAAARVAPLHLEGAKASVARACEKWARANELRKPRIEPMLAVLGLAMPFGDLDSSNARDDIDRQLAAIEATLGSIAAVRSALLAPALREELAAIQKELGVVAGEAGEPPLDPALYDAALAVRDAWARAHRTALLPRLAAARDAARGDTSGARGRPLPLALREIAPLFPVAGCTLLSMRASFPLDRDVIDRLVIDEAAQCAPIYAVPALARARRAMLTGDVAQLPPVYTLDPRVDERLARGLDEKGVAPFRMSAEATTSAQAVAEPRARTRLTLTEHFRSQHEIVTLASRWSGYRLDVRTPSRSLGDVSRRLDAPVLALPVPGVGARAPEGVVNETEAARAIELVFELIADGVAPSDIAVLTPFVGQCVRIERELVARGLHVRDGVLVSTVHRLQGGERRVVVFSVTATERRHLKWLGERPHLLHVATSRAQDHLVILVDPSAAAREPALAPLRELLGTSC
ncbi:DNA helicase [Labilithrix luteola]|uniref:DNA helicase n=1 Tax=Labilithrix luteola TaxID=1391654 RepID=A0A0K1Q4P8_9BACT|nr:AAA domain-containing protein [Labilithrix luteola]AKV00370.1 DNA helicase [Labilithrix luteola]